MRHVPKHKANWNDVWLVQTCISHVVFVQCLELECSVVWERFVCSPDVLDCMMVQFGEAGMMDDKDSRRVGSVDSFQLRSDAYIDHRTSKVERYLQSDLPHYWLRYYSVASYLA